MSQFINKLKNSLFFKSVFKVGSGQLIAQLISIFSVPILSRIYSSTAYGDHALVVSTASIIIYVSTLGLSSAIMKPEDNEEAKKVFSAAFLANAFICTLVSAVFLLIQKWKTIFSVSGSFSVAILLMWLYMLVFNTSQLLTVYINKKGKYNKLFFNPIIGAAANFILAIPLGLFGLGYTGFMITSIVNYGIVCWHLAKGDNPIPQFFSLRDFTRILKEYKEYVLFQCPSNFVENTAIEYPTQFLGRTFSTTELGGYSMCLRVLKYPLRLVAAPISTVYFRTATELHREGKNLAEFTYNMISKCLLFSFVPVAICIWFAEPIFAFALGESWRNAGTIASVLSVQYVMLFCSQCTAYCRVSINKQKTNLYYSIIHFIVLIFACSLGYAITGTLLGTIVGFSIAQTLSYIFDMSLNFYYLNKTFLRKYLVLAVCFSVLIYTIIAAKLALFR